MAKREGAPGYQILSAGYPPAELQPSRVQPVEPAVYARHAWTVAAAPCSALPSVSALTSAHAALTGESTRTFERFSVR